MSSLRLAGLLVGIVGLCFTFLFFRGYRWNRLNFIFFSFLYVSLIAVSINPDIINVLRDLLALHQYQYSRILALLILSAMMLTFSNIYMSAKIENHRRQFDNLVRKLSRQHDERFTDRLKPIMVIIPAYNEEQNLKQLLPKIPNNVCDIQLGVLVVDDGSDDNTVSAVEECGQFVVSNLINRGGGAALRLGYDILKKSDVDICITMDGDGQHKPEDIERLVSPILYGHCDVVIGSRVLGTRESDNPIRMAGVHVFGAIVSSLLAQRITDPSSGFRAFNMDAIKTINLYEDQYHTSELIIEAIKKGLTVKEIPISILKRKFGKSKKGRDIIYGLHFAKTIIKTWWR